MSLINCPDCKKQVSSIAPTCPHCGRPIISIDKYGFDVNEVRRQEKERRDKYNPLKRIGFIFGGK